MNPTNTVSYTGVTSNLQNRIWQHKNKLVKGFTEKYNITKLVYYEMGDDVRSLISREKQIKSWSRKKKLDLIKTTNPCFRDLANEWFSEV